jgi:PAS domain S-box-containing protein
MNDRTLRRVYAFFFAICAVVAIAAVAAFRNISSASAAADWVNHTHATIYALDRVVGSLIAGDGAARTFVWTGEARELAAARGEFGEMTDHLESVKALTRGDAAVHAQLTELEELAEQHAAAALALAGARQGKDRSQLEALLQSDPGLATLQEIKRRAARIRAGQFELLDQRDQADYRQAHTTRWVVGSCVVLNFFLLVATAWLVRDDLATRRRLAATLQAANETLEAKVQERTRELASANASLTTENLERQWAAQSLEHQLRYNQIIVNAASDLVFVVTKALVVTRVNPAVVDRTGRPEEEILGRPLLDLVHTENSPALTQALRTGRELRDHPARLADSQGLVLATHLTLLPIRDNDKVVGGVVLLRPASPSSP